MGPNDNLRISAFLGSALITTFLVVGFLFWQSQSEKISNSEKFNKIQDQLNEIKAPLEKIAFPDYYAATKEMSIFVLAENQSSYVNSDRNIIGTITKKIKLEGKIQNGYLLAEASVDDGRKLTKSDSIYVNLVDYGGHLLRNKSLPVPQSDLGNTLVLFNLVDVPYLKNIPYDESKVGMTNNWLDVLNSNNEHLIHTFLSSARQGGKLVKVAISYQCKDETPNCEIIESKQ